MIVLFRILNVFFLFLFLLWFSGCNKDKENESSWSACSSCTIDSWTGEYSGTAQYYDAQTNTTVDGLEISIEFEETATDYMTAYIVVPNYYSAAISGDYNSPYSISFAGSSSSIATTLTIKDNQLRLQGNSRKYHYKVDSLVIDEVINFDVYKLEN